jgi:hypothetical protein
MIDFFLIPHELPINLAPLGVCLLDAVSGLKIVGLVE